MTKHRHYYKDVSKLDTIDVYRVLSLYEVHNPCVQHAVKKLLCAGARGAKDHEKDLREAMDSIARALQMIAEDSAARRYAAPTPAPKNDTLFYLRKKPIREGDTVYQIQKNIARKMLVTSSSSCNLVTGLVDLMCQETVTPVKAYIEDLCLRDELPDTVTVEVPRATK